MPKIPNTRDREIDARLAELARFQAGFKRSRRGNLWRNWEGKTLTVFQRQGDGFYAWSIADAEGPRFSPGGYECEEGALGALWEVTGDDLG